MRGGEKNLRFLAVRHFHVRHFQLSR